MTRNLCGLTAVALTTVAVFSGSTKAQFTNTSAESTVASSISVQADPLTITPAGAAMGLSLSTFATGFPSSGGAGPFGIVFPSIGGVLVSDKPGNVRRFPSDMDGQDATTV